MNYQTAPFAADLRQARIAKGWSQRELSAKAAMPQAQISRIESGAVDPRLSTFLELARLLDLEVVLTPRNALSAVHAIIQDADTASELRTVRGATNMLNQIANLLRAKYPDSPIGPRVADLTSDLYPLTPVIHASGAMREFAQISAGLKGEVDAGLDPARLARYVDRLAHLRNSLVHPLPDRERPAYSLDNED